MCLTVSKMSISEYLSTKLSVLSEDDIDYILTRYSDNSVEISLKRLREKLSLRMLTKISISYLNKVIRSKLIETDIIIKKNNRYTVQDFERLIHVLQYRSLNIALCC